MNPNKISEKNKEKGDTSLSFRCGSCGSRRMKLICAAAKMNEIEVSDQPLNSAIYLLQ